MLYIVIKIRQNVGFFFLIKGLHAETQFTRLLSRPVEKLGGHKNNKILTYGGWNMTASVWNCHVSVKHLGNIAGRDEGINLSMQKKNTRVGISQRPNCPWKLTTIYKTINTIYINIDLHLFPKIKTVWGGGNYLGKSKCV